MRSFRKAADELFVTPAAITHQINALEEQLGVRLFQRVNRRVELTPAASTALPSFQQAFKLMAEGVDELRRDRTPQITVRTTPTFASRWVMPRLQRFLAEHPNVDVRLLGSSRVISGSQGTESNPSYNEADLEIVITRGKPAGELVDLLLNLGVVPMCHPRLINAGPHPLRTPQDLKHHTLLHADSVVGDRTRSTWAKWLQLAGATDVNPRRGLQFDHSTLALEAAADGLGVTLAMPPLAAAELERGEVVVAFPTSLALDRAYYAVASAAAVRRPEVAAFRAWLLAEASATAEIPPKKKRPRVGSRP